MWTTIFNIILAVFFQVIVMRTGKPSPQCEIMRMPEQIFFKDIIVYGIYPSLSSDPSSYSFYQGAAQWYEATPTMLNRV